MTVVENARVARLGGVTGARFQPGVSGNPGGRQRGRLSADDDHGDDTRCGWPSGHATTTLRHMRLLGIALAVVSLAVPASGASINPKLFVLGQTDVPRGYDFDESNSLLLSKATVDR